MLVSGAQFRGSPCFKTEWSGFDAILPVTVIIGRNNSGKSKLLELVAELCSSKRKNDGVEYRFAGILDEDILRSVFHPQTSGGVLGGNHWTDHGLRFVGKSVLWEIDKHRTIRILKVDGGLDAGQTQLSATVVEERRRCLVAGLQVIDHAFSGKRFRHLLADRDIRPEEPSIGLNLEPDGSGATNIFRKYITTSSADHPRELIQTDLLSALQGIFGPDGDFTEIQVKLHEQPGGPNEGKWEVYLGENKKGLVPLSDSGSGLKTVLLVLLNLLVVPHFDRKAGAGIVFAFEELENNLHPALLRRLLQYIEGYSVRKSFPVFLTTHSSTMLDLFGVSESAQIVHVVNDGASARATTVSAHFDKLGVISELGAKPSDLLQANGIIWVEGPSDCIYLNRWIDIFSNGEFQEGRDYQCAFYGGSLLARTQFVSPVDAESELINLFRVNSNIVVVCDGDRPKAKARVKDRVRRIRAEVLSIPGAHIWVTEGREIENYIPGAVIGKALGLTAVSDPGRYDSFFPKKSSPNGSYIEVQLSRRSMDKMDLAVTSAPFMDMEGMAPRFDWFSEMKAIVDRIRAWNSG